jgi:hypothetical protein
MDLTLTPTHLDRLAEVAWSWAAAFLPRLVAAVLILLIGTIVARWVSRAVYDISRRTAHIDPTLRPVLASMIRCSDPGPYRRPNPNRYPNRLAAGGGRCGWPSDRLGLAGTLSTSPPD